MIDDAAQWFALLEKNQGTPTWDEFEKLVNQRFGPPIRGNALGELIKLRMRRPSPITRLAFWCLSIAAKDCQNRTRSTSSPLVSAIP
jgi:hypothetical protein